VGPPSAKCRPMFGRTSSVCRTPPGQRIASGHLDRYREACVGVCVPEAKRRYYRRVENAVSIRRSVVRFSLSVGPRSVQAPTDDCHVFNQTVGEPPWPTIKPRHVSNDIDPNEDVRRFNRLSRRTTTKSTYRTHHSVVAELCLRFSETT